MSNLTHLGLLLNISLFCSVLRSDETRANQPENIFKREVYSNVLNAEAKKWQSGIYSAVIRAEESSQETERRHWVKSIFSSVLDAESVRDTNEMTKSNKFRLQARYIVEIDDVQDSIEELIAEKRGSVSFGGMDGVQYIESHQSIQALDKSKSDLEFDKLPQSRIEDEDKKLSEEVERSLSAESSYLMQSALNKAKSDREFKRKSTRAVTRNAAQALMSKADGDSAFRKGQFEEAIAQYSEAIDIDEANSGYFACRSAAYLKQGDNSNALKDANTSIEIDSNMAKAHCFKGEALVALRLYNDAVDAFEEGLQKCPGNFALQDGLDNVKSLLTSRVESSNESNGQSSTADTQAVKKDKGEDQAAVQDTNGKDVDGQSGKNNQMKDIKSSVRFRGEGQGANDKDTNYNLMDSAKEKAYSDEHFRRKSTRSVTRNAAQALMSKSDGDGAFRKGDFTEAIVQYTKAIEIDSANSGYFASRSAAYLKMGDNAKALEDANASIEIESTLAKAHRLRGEALLALKLFGHAVDAYEEGLQKCPDNLALQNGLDKAIPLYLNNFKPI